MVWQTRNFLPARMQAVAPSVLSSSRATDGAPTMPTQSRRPVYIRFGRIGSLCVSAMPSGIGAKASLTSEQMQYRCDLGFTTTARSQLRGRGRAKVPQA